MEYKNNEKYFKQNATLLIVGIAMIVVGWLLKLLLQNDGGWEIYQITNLLLVGGVVLSVMFFFVRPKDDELDEQIKRFISDDEEAAKAKVIEDDKRCHIIETIQLADYIPDHENSKYFKGRDGTVRTSWYSSSVIVLTEKRFYVYRRQFCITDECVTDEFKRFEYVNVENCDIQSRQADYSFGKKTASREVCTFNINSPGEVFSIIAHPDSFSDAFAERLNRRIETIKNAE